MPTLSIATWNVNSINARLQHLLGWLREDKPDVALLQECKCQDESFPRMEIEELGYNIAYHGEKSYNGVAILSKFPLEDITRGLTDNDADTQTRYIEAVISLSGMTDNGLRMTGGEKSSLETSSSVMRHPPSVIRVASVYVPNGQSADSEKFPYKLKFLERFKAHVQALLAYEEPLVIGGDYNIAPMDLDVHNPRAWEGTVLTHDAVREKFREVINLGIYDAYRLVNSDAGYSWWDYRAGAFENDNGLRIDHLLASPQAADVLKSCSVERKLRALERASDHTPVIAQFAI